VQLAVCLLAPDDARATSQTVMRAVVCLLSLAWFPLCCIVLSPYSVIASNDGGISWNITMCACVAPLHTANARSFFAIRRHDNSSELSLMPASTPIARSKTAALSRVLDTIPKGYCRYTRGTVSVSKAEAMARKFHLRYGIGCTPAQRVTKRKRGLANTLLAMYWPDGCQQVEWLMLVTDGEGMEGETLLGVADKPRLVWLGYELVRRPERGRTAWTWRRPSSEMSEQYALIAEQCKKREVNSLRDLLQTVANQPGFHGVREQSKRLFEEARRRGYVGDLPPLYYVQKVSHGERLRVV
jgi:hypothetical protein